MAREHLLGKGWGRHCIVAMTDTAISMLSDQLPVEASEMLKTEGAIVLTALYDCGIVHDSFTQEPWLQILIAVPASFNSQLSKGRNPRRIHFPVSISGNDHSFESNAMGVCQIPRECLLQLEVSGSHKISEDTKFDLKQWLAERYRQDTWPDAFNNAVRPKEKQLKKLWKRYNTHIAGLYIKLSDLSAGKYTVSAILAIESGMERALLKEVRSKNAQLKDGSIDDVKKHIENDVVNAFGDTVNFTEDRTQRTGKAIAILDENQITLHHIRSFGRFSPYSLSEYGTDAPMPAEQVPGRVH